MSAPTVCGQNADCIYILTVRGSERPPRPLRMIWNSTLDESEHFNPTRTEFSDPRCMLMCWKTRQNAHRIKSTEWSKKKNLFLILTSPQQTFAVASLSVCTPCSKMSQCEGLFIAASLSERSWDTTAPLWHHWHNFFFTTGGGGLKKGHILINNKSSGECKRYKDSLSTVTLRKRTIQKTKLRHWTDTGLGLSVLLTFHAGLYCPVS